VGALSSAFHAHVFVVAEPSRTAFAKIERDILARGIFTSVSDLRRKILRYIRRYNIAATAFRWS
jgi:hypothetical protein